MVHTAIHTVYESTTRSCHGQLVPAFSPPNTLPSAGSDGFGRVPDRIDPRPREGAVNVRGFEPSAMSDGLVIRQLERDDIDRIGEITVNAWRPAYEAYRENLGDAIFAAKYDGDWEAYKSSQVTSQCHNHPDRVRVAEVDGEVAGYVTFRVDEESGIGRIGNNAVDPDFQGRGIATRLYEHVLDEFRDRELSFATVATGLEDEYEPARRAYEKVGFDIQRPSVTYWQAL